MIERVLVRVALTGWGAVLTAAASPVPFPAAFLSEADVNGFIALGIAAAFAIPAQLLRIYEDQRPLTVKAFFALLAGAVLVAVAATAILFGLFSINKPFAVGIGIVAGFRGLAFFPALETALLARLGVTQPLPGVNAPPAPSPVAPPVPAAPAAPQEDPRV